MARFVLIWTVLLLRACSMTPAYAAPPPGADPNGPIAQWFRSLKNPITKNSCCAESDCRAAEMRDSADGSGWEARIALDPSIPGSGKWLPVPQENILWSEPNKLGRPVACVVGGQIRCFVPAQEM